MRYAHRTLAILSIAILAVMLAASARVQRLLPFAGTIAVLLLVWICIASMVRSSERQGALFLRHATRLFDRHDPDHVLATGGSSESTIAGVITGRFATFSLWRPEPSWVTSGSDARDDRKITFALELRCRSRFEFEVKRWGISTGPPFRNSPIGPACAADPVNFTTGDKEAFLFWREREDCRALARGLILHDGISVLQARSSAILVWFASDGLPQWSQIGPVLPAVVERSLDLAEVLEGKVAAEGRAARSCPGCAKPLARTAAYCSSCGSPWWAAG